jgi:translation initiation factor IF-2
MSVRIHAIAKQTSKTSKEVIAILAERGYEVKSASSTIDNITAQSLIEEFQDSESLNSSSDSPSVSVDNVEHEEPSSGSESIPFVKSKEDLDRERLDREIAEKKKSEESNQSSELPSTEVTHEEIAEQVPETSTAGNAPVLPPPPVKSAGVPPPLPAKSSPSSQDKKEESSGSVEGNLIIVKPPIVVRDFAGLIGLKPFQLISELMEMGIFASMNQTIDEEVASKVSKAKGFELEIRHRGEKAEPPTQKTKQKVDENDEKFLETRPPVVCILGHVDHGKTTLLDTLRKSNVVDGEAGGITQHVAAYQVSRNDRKVTFLDTPGHAAFSKIRERGASLTDVSVLVVAADDGFMPQTDEALKFVQRSQSSLLVAINKIDVKGADIDKVKTQMQERSIAAEDWGGEIITVPVSALNGDNIDELLDMILLQADVMELKANPKANLEAIVVEARVEVGRGPTATLIVQKGTLKVGDSFVCGKVYCKVKAMIDDKGNQLKSAPPSTPVNVLGWSGVPDSGSICRGCKNEREARRNAEEAEDLEKKLTAVPEDTQLVEDESEDESGSAAVDALFAAISKSKSTIYRLILKADVRGSVEALRDSLELINSDKIGLEVLQSEVGQITKNDVKMAQTSQADIIGFNVKMENGVMGEAKHLGVRVFQNSIIYEIIDLVKDNMADLLEPELVEKKSGRAEVRQVFKVSKGRTVAGCMVMEGNITRNKGARLVRGGEVIAEGKIDTLRRFKDDVTDVKAGFECGMRLDSFDKYEEGDVIETFEVEKIRPSL